MALGEVIVEGSGSASTAPQRRSAIAPTHGGSYPGSPVAAAPSPSGTRSH